MKMIYEYFYIKCIFYKTCLTQKLLENQGHKSKEKREFFAFLHLLKARNEPEWTSKRILFKTWNTQFCSS